MKRWQMSLILFALVARLIEPALAAAMISKSEAESIARRQGAGKILKTELVYPPGGKPYYRIKMISNGQVRTLQVDATGGE